MHRALVAFSLIISEYVVFVFFSKQHADYADFDLLKNLFSTLPILKPSVNFISSVLGWFVQSATTRAKADLTIQVSAIHTGTSAVILDSLLQDKREIRCSQHRFMKGRSLPQQSDLFLWQDDPLNRWGKSYGPFMLTKHLTLFPTVFWRNGCSWLGHVYSLLSKLPGWLGSKSHSEWS